MQISRVVDFNMATEMVDLYIKMNDESFLPSSRKIAVNSLRSYLLAQTFCVCVHENGVLRGWLLAGIVKQAHVEGKSFQQLYYVSNYQGFAAAKALVLMHSALIEEAERQRVPYVISACSHMDPGHNMCKILAHRGWETRGYLALWRTSHWKGASDVEPAPLPSFAGDWGQE